jgi:hypothetical protein
MSAYNSPNHIKLGSIAAIKARNHRAMTYGTTVTIKRIRGYTITVVPSGGDKAYCVDANILHNNNMPYK